MRTYTIEEWREEAVRRFGSDPKNWAFVCPHCGNIATMREIIEVGGKPGDAYQCCIGRFDRTAGGCDWAAFGLFGTLSKGNIVVAIGGEEIPVFAFAEPEQYAMDI